MAAGYNPLNPQPYTPPELPQQTQPGTEPMPAKPSPFGGQPGYQFTQGPISHGGAIAGIADNVLRGIVNGHAQGEQYKALKLKKQSDDLNASYQADAQRLWQVAQNQYQATGKVDPNSDEYKQAKSAVDGSWGSLQQFRGTLIDQQGGGKKKGGKKQQDEKPPQAVLTDPSSTPEEKMKAIYAISGKLGAPVYGQVAQFNTPRAQQAWHAQQQGADTDAAKAETEATMAKMQNRIAVLSAKDNLTPQEITELGDEEERYKKLRDLNTPSKESATTREYVSPDGKQTSWYVPGHEPEGWNAYNKPAASSAPKLGTLGGSMAQYAKENGMDPNNMPLAAQNYVRALAHWYGVGDTSSTTNTLKVDMNNQWVPITETNSRSRGPMPQPPPGMKVPSFVSPDSATPPAPATVTQSFKGKSVPGMVAPGNVDIANRPNIDNGDGTHSSVFSMSFGTDKGEVLVPGVGDGKTYPARKLTEQEAWDQYKKTGQNLGTFKTPKDADAYAQTLHEDQQKYGNAPAATRREKPQRTAPNSPLSTSASPRSNVRVGTPLMGAMDPVLKGMDQETHDAIIAYNTAKRAIEHPNAPNTNEMVLAFAREISGQKSIRSMPQLELEFKAGTLDQRLNSIYQRWKNGTLDPTVMSQMAEEMRANAKFKRDAAVAERTRRGQGTVQGNGSPAAPAATPPPTQSKGIVSVDQAMTLPKYKGKSRDEVTAAITAQGYTPQ